MLVSPELPLDYTAITKERNSFVLLYIMIKLGENMY